MKDDVILGGKSLETGANRWAMKEKIVWLTCEGGLQKKRKRGLTLRKKRGKDNLEKKFLIKQKREESHQQRDKIPSLKGKEGVRSRTNFQIQWPMGGKGGEGKILFCLTI